MSWKVFHILLILFFWWLYNKLNCSYQRQPKKTPEAWNASLITWCTEFCYRCVYVQEMLKMTNGTAWPIRAEMAADQSEQRVNQVLLQGQNRNNDNEPTEIKILLFSHHLFVMLAHQPTFPTLSLWAEWSVDLFAHSITVFTPDKLLIAGTNLPKTRSDSAQSAGFFLQKGNTLKPTFPHSTNPPTFLLLLHPLKSRSNWFGLYVNCVSSLFFPSLLHPPSSLLHLFSLWRRGGQVWACINMEEKKQKLLSTLLCYFSFSLCSSSPLWD